jgi:hypothetical protein
MPVSPLIRKAPVDGLLTVRLFHRISSDIQLFLIKVICYIRAVFTDSLYSQSNPVKTCHKTIPKHHHILISYPPKHNPHSYLRRERLLNRLHIYITNKLTYEVDDLAVFVGFQLVADFVAVADGKGEGAEWRVKYVWMPAVDWMKLRIMLKPPFLRANSRHIIKYFIFIFRHHSFAHELYDMGGCRFWLSFMYIQFQCIAQQYGIRSNPKHIHKQRSHDPAHHKEDLNNPQIIPASAPQDYTDTSQTHQYS